MKSINIVPILNKHDLLFGNSWINTNSNIEYLNEYHVNEFKNLSFFDNSVQVIENPKISSDKINDADDKNKNISNYKSGFTNRVRSVNSFTSNI